MSRTAFEDQLLVPTGLPPERAQRWCALSSLRALRQSVWRGRTMSLPNLLRLYQRRLADVAAEQGQAGEGMTWLTWLYRAEQPFDGTDWRRCRSRLMPPREADDRPPSWTSTTRRSGSAW